MRRLKLHKTENILTTYNILAGIWLLGSMVEFKGVPFEHFWKWEKNESCQI